MRLPPVLPPVFPVTISRDGRLLLAALPLPLLPLLEGSVVKVEGPSSSSAAAAPSLATSTLFRGAPHAAAAIAAAAAAASPGVLLSTWSLPLRSFDCSSAARHALKLHTHLSRSTRPSAAAIKVEVAPPVCECAAEGCCPGVNEVEV